ncbi:MAG: helix-turn-helix transcriptional regulator [Acetatifactor sp.]|nr:helix-turn-helix transcriptional regulator [Acetatifactor sp.]
MEISTQIKKYRNTMELSQEELAEKIYVTRQTISNWENGKSYPDIHSLLLLSSLFNVSLDQLIKGDIEIMKKEINKEEVTKFNKVSKLFTSLFVASIIAFIPLVVFLKIYGVVIWAILYLVVLGLAFKVEKLKKNNDIHTYKEIVAFSEGKHLDEIQEQREIGKRPYQAVLKVLAGAAVGIAIAAIAVIIIGLVK